MNKTKGFQFKCRLCGNKHYEQKVIQFATSQYETFQINAGYACTACSVVFDDPVKFTGPVDPESGLLHQAHLAWNALAILELMLRESNE